MLEDRFGGFTAKLFLVGFFATSFTSLIGVWQGVSLMFADFVERLKAARKSDAEDVQAVAAGTRRALRALPRVPALADLPAHDAALAGRSPSGSSWPTACWARSSCPSSRSRCMWLLNTDRTPREWRNGIVSNVMLFAAGMLFIVLCVQQVRDLPW